MADTTERATNKSALKADLALLRRAARLLVDDPRTVRIDLAHIGEKFPNVVLAIDTPDYDPDNRSGARAWYMGPVDRATRDAFASDPIITFEDGTDDIDIPVVPRMPMIPDDEKIARMPYEQRQLAVKLAGKVLNGLEIVSPQE